MTNQMFNDMDMPAREKVLVTGITGKSGSHFLKVLNNNAEKLEGYDFNFIVRESSNIGILLNSPINNTIYRCEISSKEQISKELADMEQCNTLIHIASIGLSKNIVEFAIQKGIKRLILVHTTGIFSKYKNASKEYKQIEQDIFEMVKDKNIDITILRPTMIYGSTKDKNISVFIKMVDKLKLIPIVSGAKYELQPVSAKDLGKAYFQVLMNPDTTRGKNYNLSGGAPITLYDIFETISKAFGKKNHYISVPFPIAYFGAWLIYIFTISRIDYREKVQRLIEPRTFSHEEATIDFGYNPMRFEEGVQEEIQEYIQEHKE